MRKKELQFPIEFNACPHCGSTRRVTALVTEEEIKKGKISNEAKGQIPFLTGKAAIFDPTKVSKLVGIPSQCPILVGYFDICADCGTLYCARVEKHTGQVGVEAPKGTMGFGKGK